MNKKPFPTEPPTQPEPFLLSSMSVRITKRAMRNAKNSRETLLRQIAETEARLLQLRQELERIENPIWSETANVDNKDWDVRRWPLLQEEYRRYGRQMILDQIGLEGMRRFAFSLCAGWK